MKKNGLTEIIHDVDGSVLTICETVILTEGIKIKYFMEPGANKPHEIALYIGEDTIEMHYTDSLANMFDRINEIPVIDLLKACYENLWQPKAKVA